MPLFLKNLDNEVTIFGDKQFFNLNKTNNPLLKNCFFGLINYSSMNGWSTALPFYDSNLNGYSFIHEQEGFYLKKNNNGVSENLFYYDNISDSFIFTKDCNFPNFDNKFATKTYVDSKTWSTSAIVGFDTQVRISRLDEMSLPVNNLNLNNKQINFLANGINDTDAINLGQLKALGFSSLSSNGFLSRTANNTYTPRVIIEGTNISITNGDGVGGNPTINLINNPILDRITINNAPVSSTDGVNKEYIDQYINSVVAAMDWKSPCDVATITNLSANYINGTSGVGATLTNNGTLGVLTIDDVTLSLNQRILVKNQTNIFQNGVYKVTNIGSGSVAWVLTRDTDYDSTAKITPGNIIPVINGTKNTGTTWLQTNIITSVGTTSIIFTQFSYSAMDFLEVTNNLSDLSDPVTARNNLGLGSALTSLSVTGNGLIKSGTITQPILSLNTELQGLSNLSTLGLLARTAAGTYLSRTLTAASTSIVLTNGNAVSDNPTIDVSQGLKSLDGISTNGFLKRTAVNTFNTVTTIDLSTDTSNLLPISKISATGTASQTTVLYGDGSWKTPNNGTVTSIGINIGSGMTGGGTITTSGNINVGLNTELQGLSALAANGILSRTAAGIYSTSSTINISTQTSSTLPISRLATTGTASSSTILYGDGAWRTATSSGGTVTSVGITAGTGMTVSGSPVTSSGNITIGLGAVPIANLMGYPTDSTKFLRGDGTWSQPFTSNFIFNEDQSGGISPYSFDLSESGTPNYATTNNVFINSPDGNMRASGLSLRTGGIDSLYLYFAKNSAGVYSASLQTNGPVPLNFKTSKTTRMVIGASQDFATGASGILCNASRVPLYVDGSTAALPLTTTNFAFAYYAFSNAVATGLYSSSNIGGAGAYSIWAVNKIRASEFNAMSSIEKKTIICNEEEATKKSLELFKKIEYVGYEYKDKLAEGNGIFYGVIAEELKKVWPEIVDDTQDYVPNIFTVADCIKIDNSTFKITLQNHIKIKLQVGEKIKILLNTDYVDINDVKQENKEDKIQIRSCVVTILKIQGKNIIVSSLEENISSEIFLYGTFKPCPSVSKLKMLEVSMIVLKNILNRVEKLENITN